IHCNGKILIPRNLPPTTGPCPHCKRTITSPEPGPVRITAEIAVPAVEVVREVPAAPVAPPIERAPSAVSAGTEPEVTPSLAVRSARPGSAAISEPPQVERAPVAPDADSSQKLAVRTAVVYEPGPGSAKVDKGIAASEASLAPDSGIDKAGPRDGEGRRRAGVWIPLSVAAVLVAVTGATWILVS